ncbi:hypothetical protein XFF6166_240069 [Xanthomonas citri pv. fuscans]|nr:hypothetical protein XFF6166_240069 [Xanthomonas citri pv. fuscans]SON96316.1 hypothetical protein XFF6990_320016 [Xanthomonas citri pv. fuscans]SOO01970.1 hypothetical protein XFF6960_540068 [Xanthomonas citri pv. fuscans]SOO04631.1 hypothetical protein XFF7767_260065 [Xanthomonas citri pv. fuscans]SOO07993.1 hypothetical protein XFF6970_140015 [Xanthomonas citri pv. fuscans]
MHACRWSRQTETGCLHHGALAEYVDAGAFDDESRLLPKGRAVYQRIAAFGAFALHAKVGLIFIAVAMRAPCVLPARFFKLPNTGCIPLHRRHRRAARSGRQQAMRRRAGVCRLETRG